MTFLPIVQHELRAASRRRSTFLTRAICAAIALLGAVIYILTDPAAGSPTSSGSAVFHTISILAAAMCCMISIMLASDCISEERRQGTLGLLILTDLKGYDIVLGKLLGISLNAFYCLFGVLPALALPLLFGGIEAGEFWRMCLALVNLMFFCFAVAVCVSSFCKNARASFAITGATVLFFCAFLPALHIAPLPVQWTVGWLIALGPTEPVYRAFQNSYVGTPSAFWSSLACSNLVAWLVIAIASRRLPRIFQRQRGRVDTVLPKRSKFRDRALLDQSPVHWLIIDSPLWPISVWMVAIFTVAALVFAAALPDRNPLNDFIGWPIAGALVIFKVLFAQQSSRFFVEARRSGALEALCATPIATDEFIRGQWKALKNVFLAPAVLLLIFYFVALHTRAFAPILSLQARTSFVGLNVPLLSIYLVALFVFDLVAIGWFSMWLGFSLPRPQYAVVFTLLVGVVVPAIVIIFPHPLITLAMMVNGRARLRECFRTGQFVPPQV